MIKKITGYTLAVIGALGFLYFRKYSGNLIPLPGLWLALSIALALFGIYLVYLSLADKLTRQSKTESENLLKLIQNSEKIVMTPGNCEIRENNYYENPDPGNNSRISQLDALSGSGKDHQRYIEKTALVYYHSDGHSKLKMTSQAFPINAETMSKYLDEGKVSLYISHTDISRYAFVLNG